MEAIIREIVKKEIEQTQTDVAVGFHVLTKMMIYLIDKNHNLAWITKNAGRLVNGMGMKDIQLGDYRVITTPSCHRITIIQKDDRQLLTVQNSRISNFEPEAFDVNYKELFAPYLKE